MPRNGERVFGRGGWATWVAMGALAAGWGGCASVRVTDPPRTATEQFLLSKAAVAAVSQMTFDALRGREVYIDSTYFAASESEFVLGQMRARMLLSGVRLVPERERSQVVLEVRSGGVGIDRADFLFGLPSFFVPSGAVGADGGVPLITPELAIAKNLDQVGVADVAYVAYWRETGEVVASSGPFVGDSFREDWWIFGLGPRSLGDIAPVQRGRADPLAEDPHIEDEAPPASRDGPATGPGASDEP